MIHEIKGFLDKEMLENINKMKNLMVKFDGKRSAGKFAAAVKSTNTYHVPIISDHSKIDIKSDRKMCADLDKLSFAVFLNNPSDYEGGELEIELETEIKSYKCKKGTILLYPSDRLHRVRKITKGKRIVIIGWMYCLFENPFNRYMICRSTKALNELFDYINHNKGKKEDLKDVFNTFMLLSSQYKKLSLTNH